MKELKFRRYSKNGGGMLYSDKDYYNLSHYFDNQPCDVSEDMQYTGLKDDDAIEIYECDIAIFDGEPLKCIMETDGVWFENDNVTMRHDDFNKYGESLKVIGNVHENPELLA